MNLWFSKITRNVCCKCRAFGIHLREHSAWLCIDKAKFVLPHRMKVFCGGGAGKKGSHWCGTGAPHSTKVSCYETNR